MLRVDLYCIGLAYTCNHLDVDLLLNKNCVGYTALQR